MVLRGKAVVTSVTRRIATIVLATGAILASLAGTANATEYVGWYSYPGHEPNWTCNATTSFWLGSEGWAYVQACVSVTVNGTYQQGLYNVSFSQAHANANIQVYDMPVYCFNGCIYNTDRLRSGSVGYSYAMTCFAKTVYFNQPMYAHANTLTVNGIGYSLSDVTPPSSGPSQWSSPTSHGG